MGAKNHAVIMPDADPEDVASALVGASLGGSGQRCMAISAAVFVGSEQEKNVFLDKVSEKAKKVNVGPGNDSKSELGPVITQASKDRLNSIVNQSIKEGVIAKVDRRDIKLEG